MFLVTQRAWISTPTTTSAPSLAERATRDALAPTSIRDAADASVATSAAAAVRISLSHTLELDDDVVSLARVTASTAASSASSSSASASASSSSSAASSASSASSSVVGEHGDAAVHGLSERLEANTGLAQKCAALLSELNLIKGNVFPSYTDARDAADRYRSKMRMLVVFNSNFACEAYTWLCAKCNG